MGQDVNGEDCGSMRIGGLWPGFVAWLLFGLVALLLRGVRWDENYEFAQAMLGIVEYPKGHPLVQYLGGAYSLQVLSTVGLLKVTDSAAIVCGFRNLLFIWATLLPAYLLTAVLTQRTLYGHVAAILMLSGIHLEFDGAYPQFLWPGMFSNGHIGTGCAIIIVALVIGGYFRTGYLIAGLMPAIHLGQMPPVFCFVGLYTLWLLTQGEAVALRKAGWWFLGGMAVCGALWFVQRSFALPPPVDGPYFSASEIRPIWEGRIQFHDMHRQIPSGNSHILAGATLLIGLLGMPWGRSISGERQTAWMWVTFYAVLVVLMVYGIMSLHLLLGQDIPYVFLRWIPYRLANHLPVLLIGLLLAMIVHVECQAENLSNRGPLFVGLALLFLLIRPIIDSALLGSLATRYLQTTDTVFFFLLGAGVALALVRPGADQTIRKIQWLVSVACWVALAWTHQFGAAVVFAGGFVALLAQKPKPTSAGSYWDKLAFEKWGPAACAILAFIILYVQWSHREHLPVGDFEARVQSELAASNEEGEMLVGPPFQILLQAQTGHPILVDMATSFHGSYVPSLGPSAQKIYSEIYGIDFTKAPSEPTWLEVWAERPESTWRELGREYDLRYVIAPKGTPLDLSPLFSGDNNTLYQISAID